MYALVVGNPGDFCMMYPYYTVALEESNLTNDTGAWIEYIAVCSCHKTHFTMMQMLTVSYANIAWLIGFDLTLGNLTADILPSSMHKV